MRRAFAAAAGMFFAVAASAELDSALYVWQFEWTDSVRKAIRDTDTPDRTYMVLTTEWSLDADEQLHRHDAEIDWTRFTAKSAEQIVPVLRLHTSLTPWVEKRCDALAGTLREHESAIRSAAALQGVTLGPLQLDYDCPTSRLAAYRRLLQAYHQPVTITTLPTWLTSDDFAPLVRATDGYVLQLHSLEAPRSPNELGTIFTPTPNTFIEAASRVGVPFLIALPTYGYAYHFDENGAFKRLGAEETVLPWQSQPDRHILMADPVRVAATVREVIESPPPPCRGIAWFRMPVEGDQLNWHRATLAEVMKGNAPELDLRAELKESDGRWECWLTNSGSAEAWGQHASVQISWRDGYPLAMQGLGEYQVVRQPRTARWSGPAPRVGSPPQLVGWMRFADGSTHPTITKVEVSP